jgi:hypothetical protein
VYVLYVAPHENYVTYSCVGLVNLACEFWEVVFRKLSIKLSPLPFIRLDSTHEAGFNRLSPTALMIVILDWLWLYKFLTSFRQIVNASSAITL